MQVRASNLCSNKCSFPEFKNKYVFSSKLIIAYSSTLPSTVSQMNMTRNENRVIDNAVNAAQPIFLSGEEMYQEQLMFTANEEMISHEPLLYTGPGTGVQFLNDCRMLPQFINGNEVPHQQAFMNNTVQGSEPHINREETRVQQEMCNETQGAQLDINRDIADGFTGVYLWAIYAKSRVTKHKGKPTN